MLIRYSSVRLFTINDPAVKNKCVDDASDRAFRLIRKRAEFALNNVVLKRNRWRVARKFRAVQFLRQVKAVCCWAADDRGTSNRVPLAYIFISSATLPGGLVTTTDPANTTAPPDPPIPLASSRPRGRISNAKLCWPLVSESFAKCLRRSIRAGTSYGVQAATAFVNTFADVFLFVCRTQIKSITRIVFATAIRARPKQKPHGVHPRRERHDQPQRPRQWISGHDREQFEHYPHSAAIRYQAVPSRAIAQLPPLGTLANRLMAETVFV